MFDDLLARDEVLALVILILGVIVARVASLAAGAILGFVDRTTARFATTDATLISPRLIRISRVIVFWLIVIIAISYAL